MDLTRAAHKTRYREIYDRIRSSISEGRLRAGDRLPSARALALELNVARGTVDAAYALLTSEGFLKARNRKGTIVSSAVPRPALTVQPHPQIRHNAPDPDDFTHLFAAPLPLTPGLPGFDLFPRKLWVRLVSRQARTLDVASFSYPDPLGARPLREALAAYLAVARGTTCDADQIVITGGYLSAVARICQTVMAPGAEVLLESPGYRMTRRVVAELGGIPVSAPMDSQGVDIEAGSAKALGARLCIVCPSNQFPTGVTMALPRRLALLDWAERHDGWIIEDDYAGEFRYDGAPRPALKSLDHQDRVFYVGTFSKTIFPGLRLGYVIVPRRKLDDIATVMRCQDGGRPALEQGVTAGFLSEGHFARHIKRMRSAYKIRRRSVVEAVNLVFGDRFPVQPSDGGLNLLMSVGDAAYAAHLADRAAEAGMRPISVPMMTQGAGKTSGLLLGFANLPEAQALGVIERLQRAIA